MNGVFGMHQPCRNRNCAKSILQVNSTQTANRSFPAFNFHRARARRSGQLST
jgi:hypothetical protein